MSELARNLANLDMEQMEINSRLHENPASLKALYERAHVESLITLLNFVSDDSGLIARESTVWKVNQN